jgi:putrescine transport system permease protein
MSAKLDLRKISWLPSVKTLVVAVPYLWMLLFFLVPFIIVLKISFSSAAIAIPPFSDLLSFADETLKITIEFGNYLFLTEDKLYWVAYLSSIKIAFSATVLCLLISYPLAYAIAQHLSDARCPAFMDIVSYPDLCLDGYFKKQRIFE